MNQQEMELEQDLIAREAKAQRLWEQGLAAEAEEDLAEAYTLFTEAHDLIMDCPRLHEHAHHQLRL